MEIDDSEQAGGRFADFARDRRHGCRLEGKLVGHGDTLKALMAASCGVCDGDSMEVSLACRATSRIQ
jgi:hypothetical protein